MTNIVKQLRCNLRDNSIDVEPQWLPINEFSKQLFDRLPTVKPVFMGNERECGEISAYEYLWDKATGKKPISLPTSDLMKTIMESKDEAKADHLNFQPSIYDDPVMIELIEQNKADIFSTDEVIATIMSATHSNYSWDIEIKKFDNKIFIDKRSDEPHNNILNYDTVCETSLDY